MISFQQYHEAFSINPNDWIASLKNNVNFIRQRRAKKKLDETKATIAFAKLTRLLTDMGYTVGKTNDKDGSYHGNAGDIKIIGVAPTKFKKKMQYIDDPVLSIEQMRQLFVLAHEAGHAHQYENGKKIALPEFAKLLVDMTEENPAQREAIRKHVDTLYIIWEEIDAWVKGMQFIPEEYQDKYKQYALTSYRTYLQHYGESYFKLEPLIAELLRKMDYERHSMPSIKL